MGALNHTYAVRATVMGPDAKQTISAFELDSETGWMTATDTLLIVQVFERLVLSWPLKIESKPF